MKTVDVNISAVVDGDPRKFIEGLKNFIEGSGASSAKVMGSFEVSEEEYEAKKQAVLEAEIEKFLEQVEARNLTEELHEVIGAINSAIFQSEVSKILDELDEAEQPPEEKFNTKMNSIEEWLRRNL